MCKHINLGLILAAKRGVEMTLKRKEQAALLLSEKCYCMDGSSLEVIDKDGQVGIVNMMAMSCLCIAYSHGVRCVCLEVAGKLAASTERSTMQDTVGTSFSDETPANYDEEHELLQKVDAVHEWVHENVSTLNSSQKILIKQLHTTIFSKFKRTVRSTKKKKMEHLSVNPQRLRKKQKINVSDHPYSSTHHKNAKNTFKVKATSRKRLPLN